MISAVVLTKNEEENIVDCLESVSFCEEIIVVDDYSEDRTIGVIRRIGEIREKTKIFSRHLDGDFAGQRNFGLKKAKGEWILFVDADERVTPELAREIREIGEIRGIRGIGGFYIKRRDFLFGRWLKYGEIRNIKFIRLISRASLQVRKGAGHWERRVHERLGALGTLGTLGTLKEPLLHYPHQTVSGFLREINFYTDLNAQEFYEQEKRLPRGLAIVIYPLVKFMQNYFLKLGFLDGMAGFLQASFMSFHSFLTRGKLWEMHNHD